jgi:glucose/mannose-6-phosphate isomerase
MSWLVLINIQQLKLILLTLVDISTLDKIDKQGMYKVYDNWPQIARETYEKSYEPADFRFINHIVFAGMGGSGSLSDIFHSMLSKSNVHVSIVKGYHLPKPIDSNTLVVVTSISGDTDEALTVLDSAKNMNCNIVAFSSGGKMEQYCKKNNLQYRKIPQIHSPRASFSIFLYAMLKVLDKVIPFKKEDIEDSITQLENLSKKINSSNLTPTNPSLELAQWITRIPVIYYPWGLQAAAIRFKNCLNENAKFPAITENVIEACHNGIVSWENSSNIMPVLLSGWDDHIKTIERWEILKEYFDTNNIDYKQIMTIEGSILSKLINMIYLLDYASIYRAVLAGVDPSPIKAIDFVKSRL